jgi:fosfomycin resistance protein FosX
MEGEPLSECTYDHIAFKISEAELEEFKKRLENAQVVFREQLPRVQGEGLFFISMTLTTTSLNCIPEP